MGPAETARYHSLILKHTEVAGRFNKEGYVKYLKQVLNRFEGNIILIEDGASYHQAGLVREFVESTQGRLTLERLPAFSPDFNPIENMQTPRICGLTKEGADMGTRFGSNHSAYLSTLQRSDQFIRGTEPSSFQGGQYDRAHRFEFLGRIGTQIDLGCLDTRVTEPKRDLTNVTCGLPDQHRRSVPQHMGRNAFLFQ